MDSGVGVRCGSDEVVDLVLLFGCEIRVVLQHVVESVFDRFKLSGVHMDSVQALAESGKLAGIDFGHLGVVATGAGIGFFAFYPAETYADPFAVGYEVSGLGRRNPGIVYFLRQLEFLGCSLKVTEVHLHHDVAVRFVVVTCAIGSFAGAHVVVQINSYRFHRYQIEAFLINGRLEACL